MRPSGTEPKIKFYMSVQSQATGEAAAKQLEKKIKNISTHLNIN